MSTYIIAEAGVNHNGSLDTALALVDRAREARADCRAYKCGRVYPQSSGQNDQSAQYAAGDFYYGSVHRLRGGYVQEDRRSDQQGEQ